MGNVPTDRRATVTVLVRAGDTPFSGQPTQRRLGGYLVIILGEAKPEDWPGAPFQPGDLQGIVWTTPRQAASVVVNLRAVVGVVDARE